jgi:lysophospholipase L1-like esterase
MYFDYPNAQSFARSGHDALGVPAPSTTWYFAEGNTSGNGAVAFETFLLLANQNDTPTDVTVTFHLDSGEALSRVYSVPARARYNVWVDDQGRTFDSKLLNAAFGISVLAAQPIVAERAMYWGTPSAGDPTTPTLPWREGHATAGAPSRATKWGFAEGAQDYVDTSGTRYQTFLLLSNPNPTPIVVRATFLRSDGTGIQRDQCVPGNGRQNIWTAGYPELSNQRFASFVETVSTTAAGACGAATAGGEEFVAERAMYWADGFTGGHVNIGTPWTGTITAPAAPNFTLSAALAPSALTTGRLSGGQWVDITVQNAAVADTEVYFGGRKASAVQFVGPQQVRALTPVRTKGTGYGNAGPVSVEVKSVNRTAVAGTFTFTFNVLAFGDSITYGISNFFVGNQRIPVSIAVPYPQQVKNRLQDIPQFGAYTRVTNGGWPGEDAIGYGESRLLTCLAGGAGCLKPQDPDSGYTPNPRPADFVTPFDVVVILEGVNDIRGGRAPSQVRDALKRMADNARAQGVAVMMTRMTSYKPGVVDDNSDWLAAADEMNALIWTLTEQAGLDRESFDVEMCPDGIHPTDWGYGQMGFAATAKLVHMFQPGPVP